MGGSTMTKELDLTELLQIFIKKWLIIFIFTAVGLILSFVITYFLITPKYQADTVLYIGQESGSLGNIDVSLGQLQADSQLIIDYQQLALTRLVIDEVAKNTGLTVTDTAQTTDTAADNRTMTYKEFRADTVIETVEDSRLFTVGFINADPEVARSVADELAKQLTLVVFEVVGVENIRVIDQAQLPQNPVTPKMIQNIIVGGLLGFVLSLILIFMMAVLNDRVENEADIEHLIGIPVIGEIPEFRKE
jgi:capsular polysaccharide biosynthesis protein